MTDPGAWNVRGGPAPVRAGRPVGRRWSRRDRGVSLIEGIAASSVLLFGLLGALQAIIFASRQNSMANRMTRAATLASQVRAGLQAQGRARLVSAQGPLDASRCSSNATVLAHAGGLESLTPAPCVVDLDAYESASAGTNRMIVPSYSAADGELYKRVLVHIVDPNQPGLDSIGVVVSWNDAGAQRFAQQFLGLYDPAVNQTNVEL